jgi:tetracycline 7-halogenase / FADH2 O2-dependent halogenase
MPADRGYDVAILGAGIGGTLLGAILARQGLEVLLLEQGSHPRFAIGESTIPETTILLRLMAKRYDLPEIGYLSNFNSIRAHVGSGCGVKRNFSFVYHREGEPGRPEETTQFPTWAPPFGPDVHYFRQDVDSYMLAVAVAYGATARQQTEVVEIDFRPAGVRLLTRRGESFRARYVVDAGGPRAPLAQQFGLREEPCPLRTRSRTIFTHLVGVAPYDRCSPARREHRMPSPLCQGTLHHLFAGGWMWVIPFDNHPASTNPLCSVGLTLDLSRHPADGLAPLAPEEEIARLAGRFPDVARQLEYARPVRGWTATGRLQYSASRLAGDRFCLLPHAAAFVDPLFSSGLAITVSAVNGIADRLISACRDGDFSAEPLRFVETWVSKSFAYYDRLVACSYVAFGDFPLWNAWHRVWMLGSLYGVSGLFEILSRYDHTGDPACFKSFELPPYRGVQALDFEPYQELFDAAAREVEAVGDGQRSPGEAAGAILEHIAASGLAPAPWRLDRPAHRCPGTFTLLPMLRLAAWGRYRSPAAVRRHYFIAGRTGGLLADLCRTTSAERRRNGTGRVFRDALWSWNQDWQRSGSSRRIAPAGES